MRCPGRHAETAAPGRREAADSIRWMTAGGLSPAGRSALGRDFGRQISRGQFDGRAGRVRIVEGRLDRRGIGRGHLGRWAGWLGRCRRRNVRARGPGERRLRWHGNSLFGWRVLAGAASVVPTHHRLNLFLVVVPPIGGNSCYISWRSGCATTVSLPVEFRAMTRNAKQGLDALAGETDIVWFRPDGKSGESCLGRLNKAACSPATGASGMAAMARRES